MPGIVNITIGSMDASTMSAAVASVASESGVSIDIRCANSQQLENDVLLLKDVSDAVRKADLVLVRCLMDPSRYAFFGKMDQVFLDCPGLVFVNSANSDVSGLYRHYFRGSDEEFALLNDYVGNRGEENDCSLTYWLLDRMGIVKGRFQPPMVQRTDGIYHPDYPRDVSFEDYLPRLIEGRPTIGLMFVSTHWIYGNLAHIDAVIRTAESEGYNIIPVFFRASSSNSLSEKSTGDIFARYFTLDGKVIVDAVIMNSPFPQAVKSYDEESNFYRRVTDVPVIQAMLINGRFTDYEDVRSGKKKEFAFQSSWAELDGQIISVPIAETVKDENGRKTNMPIEDRVRHILKLAGGWAELGVKENKDKKVAIILYQSRPDLGSIGSAAGLDGPQSAVSILERLKSEGYTVDHVPEDGKALIDELLGGVTNNLDWTDSDRIRDNSAGLVTKKQYMERYSALPEFVRTEMEERWGAPPGELMTEGGKLIIPGVYFGNVLVTVQPLRAWMDMCECMIHDPELFMSHQYYAFYRWLEDSFGVDAVIHLGTHGTVEWLPGKPNALSSKCCPDAVLNGIPNIYPFQMDDPGEGIQAKRRSEACLVGYLCTPMARAELHGDAVVLEGLLQEYLSTSNTISAERKTVLVSEIRALCTSLSVFEELGWDPEMPDDDLLYKLPDLNDHLLESGDELIREGLHVLGRVPEGPVLDSYVYSLTRNSHGGIPSLSSALEGSGCTVDVSEVIAEFGKSSYDYGRCTDYLESLCKPSEVLKAVVEDICKEVVPRLKHTSDEMDAVADALSGRYIMPGPSGAPTRSGAAILPSGRNYYGLDPATVPSRSAWEVGCRNADQMLEKFREEKGAYPVRIGFVVWATDTMKTNGDDIAYALWLMGVRPVWAGSFVTGLEVIPLSELGRPRVDVTIRITGLFRDSFPSLIDLLDDAVQLVAELDEDDESNAIAAGVRRETAEAISRGIREDEARRAASVRIFGSAPGTYGSGMNMRIGSSDWKDTSDLAGAYREWGAFGYGRNLSGKKMEDSFTRRFSSSQALVKNLPDKEIGMVDMDDVYGYLGGLTAFVKSNGNEGVAAYVGDTSDTDGTKVRTASAALKLAFRSQITNPKFIRGLMNHGYAGVNEVSKMTEYVFGWDATSDIVEKYMYDDLAESYVLNDEVYEWMKKENPFALTNVLNRLQEAINRGMWDADDEMKQRILELYLDVEETIEEVTDR